MTFNLLSTNRQYDAIIGAIEEAQPDLIAFAELNPVTHDALVERLGEEYPYQAFYRLPGAGFGNGIYSRWPLDVLGPVQTGLGLRSVMADVYLPGGALQQHPARAPAEAGAVKAESKEASSTGRRRSPPSATFSPVGRSTHIQRRLIW
jgi:hypothetical protein